MIYWDHNAGTPVRAAVRALVTERLASHGNAASVHQGGRRARARLDEARARIALLLGCEAREVCFTASGSEANALALKGAFFQHARDGKREIVTSTIEHPSVLAALAQLERRGAVLRAVAPDTRGCISWEAMQSALSERTVLCTLMAANNETGVLQPASEAARECRWRGILFHTDAVQLAGKGPLHLRDLDASTLALSGHKFGAPPGTGLLVVRKDAPLEPLTPGHQEGGLRGGSSDVTGAEALALALELSGDAADFTRMAALRDAFEANVRARVSGVTVQGDGASRLPNTSNLRFEGVDGEALLIGLDLEGICVSSGAACTSGSLKPSHVLTQMGLAPAEAQQCLRFSLGPETTAAHVDWVVAALARLVETGRQDASHPAARGPREP